MDMSSNNPAGASILIQRLMKSNNQKRILAATHSAMPAVPIRFPKNRFVCFGFTHGHVVKTPAIRLPKGELNLRLEDA